MNEYTEIKVYTVEQAAKKLSVSDQTVRLWLREGLIKGTKIGDGRIWRITEEAITEFLKRGEKQ